MLRFVAIIIVIFILVNLFFALYHLLRGGDRSGKVLRSLAIRVALSFVLFFLAMIAVRFGQDSA